MFRPTTQQLARCIARASLRTPARLTYRTTAFARLTPLTRAPSFRFYSSQPPSPPSNNDRPPDKQQNPEDPAATPEVPLPPGWVRLSEEELQHLERLLNSLPASASLREGNKDLLKGLKRTGAPEDFRELLQKQRAGNLTMMDAIRALRVLKKVADGIVAHDKDVANAKSRSGPDFTSNQPSFQDQKNAQQPGEQKEGERQQQQQQENQGQDGFGQGQGPKRGKGEPKVYSIDMSDITLTAGVIAGVYTFYTMFSGESSRDITWQELRRMFLDKGLVERMTVVGDRVRVDMNLEAVRSVYPDSPASRAGFHYYFSIGSVDAFERRLDEAQQELGIPASERIPVTYASQGVLGNLVLAFGPTLLLVGLLVWMSRRAGGGSGGGPGGMFGFGKSKAKMFNHDSAVKVKFADVAGMDEAKVEIMEFVSFLRTPERFQRLGAKIPRGAILSGPPGTGKTLLAKATAGESQVPFFSVSGSEFVEMFVGVGASRVRDLFATARKNAPCIIFIDEIDAIGRSRSEGGGFRGGGNDEREATLNQILTEMDGFNTSEQVVVLAGTNRPDILDQALMRPGRFDRHIHIDRPTMKGRQDIFRVHLKHIVTKEDMDHLTGRLAALTPGFAGADIANAVNEAALVGEFG